MLEDSLQELSRRQQNVLSAGPFCLLVYKMQMTTNCLWDMKNSFYEEEKNRGEERGRGTAYLLLDLSDYRDKDTTLCRKISSHSPSLKGFSFFWEIPQTCPPAPSVCLSSGYELDSDTNGKQHFSLVLFIKRKRLPLKCHKEQLGYTCSLCRSLARKVRGRERFAGSLNWEYWLILEKACVKLHRWMWRCCFEVSQWDEEEEKVIRHWHSIMIFVLMYVIITT